MTLGISPQKISINSSKGQAVCENFSLKGDKDIIFDGEIKWSYIKSEKISDYNISSEELEISSFYPTKINPGKYEICINAKNKGKYYGALLYSAEETSFGIGSWIELEISGVDEKNYITGGAIGKESTILVSGLFIFFILLLALLVIIFRK
jgi:hypothetical protein